MSKRYIAQVENIFFKGKRYNSGDAVLVDDKEKMHPKRWMSEKDYLAKMEQIAKETNSLTEKESDAKIKDLMAKLEDAEQSVEDAVAEKEAANARVATLEQQLQTLTERLAALENAQPEPDNAGDQE